MASDWEVIKLSDFVDIKTGFPFKSKQYLEHGEGYKLLRGDNVVQGAFRWANVKLWSKDELTEKQKDYFLEEGDVILAMDRPWIEAGLKTAQITNKDLPCLLVQRVARLQAKNSEDQDFLRYLVSSYWFVEYLKLVQTGTAIPHISTKQILSYETKIPPLIERKNIGRLLRSLDDKIELNRQMNETLEAMAQALFKSWFVDFDPVIDNALAAGNAIPDQFAERAEQRKGLEKKDNSNIQDLFPDEFEFTEEMGWIPRGWAISTLGQESDFSNGYAFKSKELTAAPEDAFHVFKMGHIKRGGGFNYDGTKSYFPIESAKDLERYLLKKGDLLMAMTDMKSSMALLGHTALMPEDDKFLVNQRVGRLSVKEDATLNYPYIYIYSNLDTTISELRSRANSGVQVNLSTAEIKATNILVPSKSVHDIFDVKAVSFFEKTFLNDQLNRKLAETRDTLLPKLMSGELHIADAEALMNEAI